MLAVANTIALLVLLWVFLLDSTESLQQQGLEKLQERKNSNDYVLPARDTESRRLPASVSRGVGDSAYR
jgi:hypothetical protein